MQYDISSIAKNIVNLMLTIVGALLGLRFILRLFGANATNGFVDWVYRMSADILGPFRGIFPSSEANGYTIEFSTIFALMVYIIIGMLAFYVIDIITPTRSKSTRSKR